MKKLLMTAFVTLAFLGVSEAYACTNFIVTKGASVDGSVMISYNADAGGFMEPLFFLPAADHKPGDSLEVFDWDTGKYLGKIDQPAHTYKVLGNMNEFQVSIGETTFGGREELVDTLARIDYGSLMRIGLQRAKTARECIKVMADLVAKYGYYSEGESFSVADKNEAWVMEIVGKGKKERGAEWAAVRIPDGMVAAHANQSRIRKINFNDKENYMWSGDVVSFAEKEGFYNKEKNGEFSFRDAYCPPDAGALIFCENRVWRLYDQAAPSLHLKTDYWRAVEGAEPYPLYIKPDRKLSYRDVIDFMRDHNDGTQYDLSKGEAAGPFGCPVRWKPLVFKMDGDTVNSYGWERPISTQQTAFAFVAQSRSFMPDEIGGVFWYGVDDNYTNVYIPLYVCMTKPPKSFEGHSISDFSMESGFWVFNLVANLAYTKYSYMIHDIQPVQSQLENKFELFQPAIEKGAMELFKKDTSLAVDYLTDYSYSQAEMTVDRWRELWRLLVMKYNDGYINDVNKDNGRNPKGVGYGNEYYKKILKDRPGYYDIKMRKNNP